MIGINITIKENPAMQLSKRAQSRVFRQMFQDIGDHWHQNMLPRHFKEGAARKYDYQPRTDKWRARKIAMARRGATWKGRPVHRDARLPLILTGRLKEEMERPSVIRAYPTRVTVQMHGPNYLRINHKGKSTQPSMRDEITVTTDAEVRVLERIGARSIEDNYAKEAGNRRVTAQSGGF